MAVLSIAALSMALLIAGCSSSGSAGESESTAEQAMTDAAVAMADVDSAAFTIEQTGASIAIDDAGQLGFQSAEGRYAAPASAEAVITVDALGFTTQVGAVAIDGTLWFTNPLSGEWTEAPESLTFDPATVFDPDQGLPVLLEEGAAAAEYVTAEEVGDDVEAGDSQRWVRTAVGAERVSVLTGGLVTSATDVDLLIDTATDRLAEVRFDLDLDDGVSNWVMTVDDYDADVTIDPPELGSGGG